ncbi:5-oxoprolinase subunit PxpB [Adhaeribacter radiodurans]|uniref:5-oxoprolinase subunit PxpB n=1 Tax=Adhaeribacter radiodurans TaxID=2745197 RepID=A0A7L7LBQ1_9BACT|nr:5-oxoprolinase subunit PxpB [Adhaeribacter radiodurans]QMU29965.1 5-oxoprolinase subunit PxpB [Adhaeribacter radiodurans]
MENPVTPVELPEISFYPLGDAAIVLEFGDHINRLLHGYIQAFTMYLDQHPFPGLVEYVPAFTTLTVYYDPWVVSQQGLRNPYQTVAAYLAEMRSHVKAHPETPAAKTIEIPVCYGGKYGPDMDYVAQLHGLKPKEVIKLHTQTTYLVYMIGFAPGFPYLGGMTPEIAAPRKDKPRAKVPAGSVGIADRQTGVYPIQSPGGWQLIGRTPLLLFNPHRDPPSLLQAGDMIRFVAITEKQFEKKKALANGH